MRESLRFVLVGHVDHGKSTLIGRLLYDTGSIALDRLEEARRAAREFKAGAGAEFAFLLDHLREEREGALTLDTAQTFFSTPVRDYVLIDAPGHVEFLKNMITGAAQADAAVLIVDASRGVQEQTRRHAYILALLGLKEVIVALNKMDLVGYREEAFRRVKQEVETLLEAVGLAPRFFIPISAKEGENIARTSEKLAWYHPGPSLLEALDSLPSPLSPGDRPLVFPIQDLYELDGKRIIVGRVEAGVLRRGAKVRVLPEGELVTIRSIERWTPKGWIARNAPPKFGESPIEAHPGEAVGVTVEEGLTLERGQVLCLPGAEPAVVTGFTANLFCLAKGGLELGEELTLRLATQEVQARLEAIEERLDSASLEVLEREPARLECLDVGRVWITTASPIVATGFAELRELGRFVLDRKQGEVSAGGIITGFRMR
ncbi:MAG: sulfate adenylyltransferase subunit 1 [Candidatus Bipolaricaulia bacterium]